MKKILVINNGSTQIKFSLFDLEGNLIQKKVFLNNEVAKKNKWLKSLKNIEKIGFRIVHGGDIKGAVKLGKKEIQTIKDFTIFAPIHNSLVLNEIEHIKKLFKGVDLYGCFDTSFHQTISKDIYTYPINQTLAKKYKLRKYGFHGIAVESVLEKVKKEFKKRKKTVPKKIIFAHLGGGSSITAVKDYKSFATTMELTPISGLMMATRVGNVDSDLDKILAQKTKKSIYEVSDILNYKSGFLGLTGKTDIQKIFDEWKKNTNEKSKLAVEIYINQIINRTSGFIGLMGGIDLVVFSGGIGLKNKFLAQEVMKRLAKTFGKIAYEKLEADEARQIFENIKNK